jgi:hypothetical protein
MGTIEVFLTKIATAVLKKAAVSAGYGGIVRAWEIYSVFHSVGDAFSTVESVNDCNTLGVKGLRVLSDELTQKAADALVEFGAEKFSIRQDASGVYIAARIVPEFRTDPFAEYGGPVTGGTRVPDAALNDMYYRANLESARQADREGRHKDATACRRTAELFRTGGKNAAMYDLWMESAREWASRGNHEKAQYCEEQAK